MTKHETILQYTKIVLAFLGLIMFAIFLAKYLGI